METKDLGFTKTCDNCNGGGHLTIFAGMTDTSGTLIYQDAICHICDGRGRVVDLYDPPWSYHVYLAPFEVDPLRIEIWRWMRLPDSGVPDWYNKLKMASIPNPHENYGLISSLDLIKVGWTTREDPSRRIEELLSRGKTGGTVWCKNVPVRPTGNAVFLIGTEEAEQMLHRRWGKNCTDCRDGFCKDTNHTWIEGEFFERNNEMIELGLTKRTTDE